jgi:hypothetical protein
MGLLRIAPGAEKAGKTLHLRLGQEAWGHTVVKLLQELPGSVEFRTGSWTGPGCWTTSACRRGTRTATREARPLSIAVLCRLNRGWSMPVRSSTSPILRWPDRPTVRTAFGRWVEGAAESRPELRAAGYFGSCATAGWGVGSDLDVAPSGRLGRAVRGRRPRRSLEEHGRCTRAKPPRPMSLGNKVE